MLQVLVLGLISAGIYAMFAVGIVLVYRGTKVLNFGGGEVGTAALYVAAFFVTDHHAPWIVGALAAVVFAIVLGAAFEFFLVRRSVDADPVVTSILTVGLTVTLLAIEIKLYGGSGKQLAAPVHGGVQISGIVVSPVQIASIIVAAALGFGLQTLLRRTDFGLGILAAADDPAAVRLVGIKLSRIRLVLWAGSFALAATAALLVEPTVGLISPGYATKLYLGGLAAAVIGGLTSLPGAVIGAVVLGLIQETAHRLLNDAGIPGLEFVVLLALLLVALIGRSAWPQVRQHVGNRTAVQATA